MIRKILPLSLGLLFLLPRTMPQETEKQISWSAFEDGNKLLAECENGYIANKNYCLGYIAGTADSFKTLRFALEVTKQGGNPTICLPKNATLQQLRDVFLKYVREHPETRHLSADYLATAAWSESFRCEEKK
jgi:hypothetical protein